MLCLRHKSRRDAPPTSIHFGLFNSLVRLPYAHKNNIDGSGIGLAIVKSLIVKMHGTITVSSEEQIGSRFVVTLGDGKPLKNQPSTP